MGTLWGFFGELARFINRFVSQISVYPGTKKGDKSLISLDLSPFIACTKNVSWCPEPESNRHALTGGRF